MSSEPVGRITSVVTIDGPAASGKSTVARMVADRVGIPFVSSGLLYRGATLMALKTRCRADDPVGLLRELGAREVSLEPAVDGNRLTIDGHDATVELHTDEVDAAVSSIAGQPAIRTWVNQRLREIREPFVVEGRDMGTIVFPEARHKFYLTAPAEVRARRRLGERAADLASVTTALQRRDEMDADRLARATDAVTIDTGRLNLDQVVEQVLSRLPGGGG